MATEPTENATSTSTAYDPSAIEGAWYRYWEARGFFRARADEGKPPHTIMMPPPNVTGRLHMGHALQDTIQDTLTRLRRMQGYEALWMPGMDHAGIATQNVVERTLKEEGLSRKEMGREAFVEKVWDWVEEYGGIILQQKRRLGDSCDWSRERFTLDERYARAVQDVFVQLYHEGLVYRGHYLVNWDPENQTAISDEEVDNVERDGQLWYVRYPLAEAGETAGDTDADDAVRAKHPSGSAAASGASGAAGSAPAADGSDASPQRDDASRYVTIATTRPETMLGDAAIAVHPEDARYTHLVGRKVILPLLRREIPIIADEHVKSDFGAGALKITPAHDKNDFEIGKRHDLEVVGVMNPDGTISEEGGPYAGLDRFEARKKIVADLEKEGLLEKTEPYKNTVPISSRSKAVIEPLISRQWFVKMRPLAEPALEAVRSGEIKFYPERWANEYFRWLENIRDWTISRQLWWGHRIPVWYYTDESGEVDEGRDFVVSVEQPEPGMVQDADVLDTWFSSWLWPFATLGWPGDEGDPDVRRDLDYFYPTSVLVSGYDILFFWIARMIMAGLHFTGKVPYRDIFITGMIKDKEGRWMSKSLGNGIDPLEMIETYGADAVRFSLTVLCAQGQDIKLDPSKFEMGRNFANKIWNAFNVFGQFMETADGRPGETADGRPAESGNGRQGETEDDGRPGETAGGRPAGEAGGRPVEIIGGRPAKDYRRQRAFGELELVERWMLTRLNETVRAVEEDIARYRLNEALTKIYTLFWGDYCDWYLELIKPPRGERMSDETIALAVELYERMVQLLHPFMPFITEALWWRLRPRKEGEACIVSKWPEANEAEMDEGAAEAFGLMQELISGIRSVKSDYGVAPGKEVAATVNLPPTSNGASGGLESQMAAHAAYFEKLARVTELKVGSGQAKPKASASVVVGQSEVYVPLAGMIDLDVERERLGKEIARKEQFVAGLEKKLRNEQFMTKAPPEVVERERQKRQDAAAELNALRANLEDLG